MFGFRKRDLDWSEVKLLFWAQLAEAYRELGEIPRHAYLMSRLDKFVSEAKLNLTHEQRTSADFAALILSMTPSEFDTPIRKVVSGGSEGVEEIFELLRRKGCGFGPNPTLDEVLQSTRASALNPETLSLRAVQVNTANPALTRRSADAPMPGKKWALEGDVLLNRETGEKFKVTAGAFLGANEVSREGSGYSFHRAAKYVFVNDWDVDTKK